MSTKKYLSVEEAAEFLGLATSEVLRAREQDRIRGFADRGTWKFKAEDVENYKRELGSDLEISGTDVLSDDDVLSEQPTVIRKGEQSSDSDVRLIYSGSSPSDIPLADSDSDVRLAGAQKSALDSSDSDVKLVQGDKSVSEDRSVSDVRLTPLDDGSDLNLGLTGSSFAGSSFGTASSDSDSDVKLVGRASSHEMPVKKPSPTPVPAARTADDTVDFNPPLSEDDSSVLDGDSGISLVGDSGISLERPADSGISLEKADSGISLSSDSALNLAHDSGISLDITSDSGISLAESIEDSEETVRKMPVPSSRKGAKTMPELDIGLADDLDVSDTNMEVPLLDDDDSKDSSYDLADSADSTSVITLDEDSGDEFTATPSPRARKPASSSEALEAEIFDDEDVEVADELGEDDELEEMDVFEAGNEDFDDSFQEGESQHDMEVAPRQVAAVEHEWGTGVVVSLCAVAFLMLLAGTVTFDLVQEIWHADTANRTFAGGAIVEMLAGMF